MVASQAEVEQAGDRSFTGAQTALLERGFSFSGYERDVVQLNLGPTAPGRQRFLNISGVTGLDAVGDGRGTVFADFDNDGDTDIFVTSIQGEAHLLYRNQVGNERHWLRVELLGTASGSDACGAVVRVTATAGTLTRIKACGSGYLSQSDGRLLFGLGDDRQVAALRIRWPSGAERTLGPVAADQAIRVVEGEPGWEPVAERRFTLPAPLRRDALLAQRLAVAAGATLPDLAVRALDGTASTLHAQLRPGRRTLLNLWATYCVPCRREMPELSRRLAGFERHGIDVLGLSLDRGGPAPVRNFLQRLDIRYASLQIADDSVAPAIYGGNEVFIPLSLLVEADGTILDIFAGGSRGATARALALAGEP